MINEVYGRVLSTFVFSFSHTSLKIACVRPKTLQHNCSFYHFAPLDSLKVVSQSWRQIAPGIISLSAFR